MTETCEACRKNITMRQKCIKCSNCLCLYHSFCTNFKKASVPRLQWKCPFCVSSPERCVDNNTSSCKTTTSAKDIPTIDEATSSQSNFLEHQPLSGTSSMKINGASSMNEDPLVSQFEHVLDIKLTALKEDIIELMHSLIAEFRHEILTVNVKYDELKVSHLKLLNNYDNLNKSVDILKEKVVENKGTAQDLEEKPNKQQECTKNLVGVQLQSSQIKSNNRFPDMKKTVLKDDTTEFLKSILIKFRQEISTASAKYDDLQESLIELLNDKKNLNRSVNTLKQKMVEDTGKVQVQLYTQQQHTRCSGEVQMQPSQIESTDYVQVINEVDLEQLDGKTKLRKWLNMNFRIEMTDGRVLIGVFLCTDRDANVILGACSECLKNSDGETEEPRVLGLVMVPGRHIVSIQLDDTNSQKI